MDLHLTLFLAGINTPECIKYNLLECFRSFRLFGLQNDLENGNGTFIWTDGYKFSGAWIDGRKTGYGEYLYKNGDNYKGNVRNNYL